MKFHITLEGRKQDYADSATLKLFDIAKYTRGVDTWVLEGDLEGSISLDSLMTALPFDTTVTIAPWNRPTVKAAPPVAPQPAAAAAEVASRLPGTHDEHLGHDDPHRPRYADGRPKPAPQIIMEHQKDRNVFSIDDAERWLNEAGFHGSTHTSALGWLKRKGYIARLPGNRSPTWYQYIARAPEGGIHHWGPKSGHLEEAPLPLEEALDDGHPMTFREGYELWCDPNVTPRYYRAVQHFINGGYRSTGADCQRNDEAVKSGWCLLAPGQRDAVPKGSPGTWEYVAAKMGREHADRMASLGKFAD